MAAPLTLLLILAVTIRAALYRSSLAESIAERVEVISPLTSWKRGKREFGFFLFFFAYSRGVTRCLTEDIHVKPVGPKKISRCGHNLE